MEQTSVTQTVKEPLEAAFIRELGTKAPKPPKPKTQGIVLIALGHPYYAHMAFTLALSIRYKSPEIPIAIFEKDGSLSQLSETDKLVFDKIIEMPDHCVNGRFKYDPYKAKLHLYELTPWDETLFLDADMIVSPTQKISDLMHEMALKDIMFANRGEIVIGEKSNLVSQWCDLEDIKTSYGVKKVYDISSEVFYFKKTPKVKKVFETARKVYDDYKFHVKPFGVGKPDEVFLMVALALEGVRLTPSPFHPTYWQPFYFSKLHSREFMQSHYAISVGGNRIQKHVKKIYDSIANHYYNRMGIKKSPYQLIPKSRVLKERSKI